MTSLYCRSNHLANIEAIVFDKDGTLADSRLFLTELAQARVRLCVEAVSAELGGLTTGLQERLLAVVGVGPSGLDPDGLMAVGTRRANEQATEAALVRQGYLPEVVAKLVVDRFRVADRRLTPKARFTPPFAGTAVLLERLGVSPIQVGVLSSDSTAHVDDFLTTYDLRPWVRVSQGTEDEDEPKPSPELLYRLCDRLGVSVSKTVIVGDSWVDLALAQRAGAAGFLSVSEAWGRPPVPGAGFVLTGWDDLVIEAD